MANRRGPTLLLRSVVAGALAATALAADRAWAQATTAHDTSLPIEITADSLEVKQKDQLAVFRGNVNAVQGTMRLTASEIRVHYRAGSGSELQGAISRIDAAGQVRVATPNETAQGDAGVYDVDGQLITLTGSVMLTSGDHVIRGEKLTLDLATGQGKIEGPQRVRGLFQPKKNGSGS